MRKDLAGILINQSDTKAEVGLTTSLKQLEVLSPRLFEEIKRDAGRAKMFRGDKELQLGGYTEVILPTIKRLGVIEFSHLVASLPHQNSFREFAIDRCNVEVIERIIICTNFYPPESLIPKDPQEKNDMEFQIFNLAELLINCANKNYQSDSMVGSEETKARRMDLLVKFSFGINALKFSDPESYVKAFRLGANLKEFVLYSLIDGSTDRSPERLQRIITDRCKRLKIS